MKFRAGYLTCVLAVLPVAAQAQTLSASIEGSGGAGSSTSNGQAQTNNSFWQGYSIGFTSPLINPKLIKLDTEVSFRSGSLNFFAPESDQDGKQRDVGYKLGGTVFPAGQFPFTIQATRDNIEESGTYPSSDGIRGGIVVPPGEPSPDFRTRMKALTMGWQLSVPHLPHVEFGYRSSDSQVTGGPYTGEQRDDQLHLGVSQATAHTQQALRFDRNAFESPVAQAYNQRFDDLNYEFGATLSNRFHASTRLGRRNQFSVFEVPMDPDTGNGDAYRPPLRGDVSTMYSVTHPQLSALAPPRVRHERQCRPPAGGRGVHRRAGGHRQHQARPGSRPDGDGPRHLRRSRADCRERPRHGEDEDRRGGSDVPGRRGLAAG